MNKINNKKFSPAICREITESLSFIKERDEFASPELKRERWQALYKRREEIITFSQLLFLWYQECAPYMASLLSQSQDVFDPLMNQLEELSISPLAREEFIKLLKLIDVALNGGSLNGFLVTGIKSYCEQVFFNNSLEDILLNLPYGNTSLNFNALSNGSREEVNTSSASSISWRSVPWQDENFNSFSSAEDEKDALSSPSCTLFSKMICVAGVSAFIGFVGLLVALALVASTPLVIAAGAVCAFGGMVVIGGGLYKAYQNEEAESALTI